MELETWNLYLITNKVSGLQYIGVTRQDPERRFYQHANTTYSKSLLNQSIQRLGRENFEFSVLDTLKCNVDEISCLEKGAIAKYNCQYPNGYNRSEGGVGDRNALNPIKINNRIFKNFKECCLYYDIKPEIAYGVRYDHKFSFIQTIKYILEKRVTINNLHFKNLSEACRHFNVNYGTVWAKINKQGQSPEVAIRTSTEKEKRKPEKINVNNKVYTSVRAACRELNIDRNLVRKFKNQGLSYEESFKKALENDRR